MQAWVLCVILHASCVTNQFSRIRTRWPLINIYASQGQTEPLEQVMNVPRAAYLNPRHWLNAWRNAPVFIFILFLFPPPPTPHHLSMHTYPCIRMRFLIWCTSFYFGSILKTHLTETDSCISDRIDDERWLKTPSHPYGNVKSALEYCSDRERVNSVTAWFCNQFL